MRDYKGELVTELGMGRCDTCSDDVAHIYQFGEHGVCLKCFESNDEELRIREESMEDPDVVGERGTKKDDEDWKQVCLLPNGCMLYVKDNGVGGRTYMSDEIACGIIVWDTAICSGSTLLAAMTEEARLVTKEYYEEQEKKREKSNLDDGYED
jgi:hypothetical protein